ncbi:MULTISPECIES: hypothetical protein [unclassified Arcicella]|uniref:hypothetical protein n=1 Tax=unclassified Arcicella TaxID=2644986 RepID=UPI002863D460|nr:MULTISPECIES: hypothetical protein [unclassified Arcicella]MDR6561018.1 hypothetical protein [Arcicella sp. BE51]MDR6810902.1 hypothetical protein [Arcicella sp. BE140]MDR6822252.1 hypothetical protein [Arcicella sp. BE139]
MENTEEILEKNDNVEIQYIISTNKFIVLSILSFGFYITWWTLKRWRFFRQKDQLNIMPGMRANNDIFFVYSLFNTILKFAKQKGYPKSYSSFLLSIFCILLDLIILLFSPIGSLVFLLVIPRTILMIPLIKALNFAQKNSTDFRVVEQSSFNRRQKVLLFFGGFYWLMIILAILLEANFI